VVVRVGGAVDQSGAEGGRDSVEGGYVTALGDVRDGDQRTNRPASPSRARRHRVTTASAVRCRSSMP
jgi:hypothetical protein